MNNSKKQNSSVLETALKLMISDIASNIKNGSVTVIKQDDLVIQINVNEKIYIA